MMCHIKVLAWFLMIKIKRNFNDFKINKKKKNTIHIIRHIYVFYNPSYTIAL